MRIRSFSLLSLAVLGCGGGGDPGVTPDAAEDYTLGEHPQLAMACDDTLADVYKLPTGLPTMDDSHRGDVFRCAKSEKMMVPEIKAQVEAFNGNDFNSHPPFENTSPGIIKSGFYTYRIAYRTTRATNPSGRPEGDTAAILLVPAKPIDGAPVIVFGHGSTGFAEKCAPSRLDLSAPVSDQDYPPQLYRLAGYGYTVIAPDYAGFSYGQPPGYFNAEDEAHAILDATRAAAKILSPAPTKYAFVGHSQGGHAVLSAHSYAKAYGMAGELVGVATMAPYWFSLSGFAAITSDAADYMTTKPDQVGSILYAMTYAYSAGEMRAPGTGLSVFKPSKQAAAKEVINGAECYDAAKMQALGTRPSEFFEDDYVTTVAYSCAANGFTMSCPAVTPTPPASGDAATWKARWIEDRPPIDPKGAPILAMFGSKDTFIKPGYAKCAVERFTKDLQAPGATTTVQYCVNNLAQHRDIIRGPDVDYINQWIAARAGAGPEPTPCPEFTSSLPCYAPPNDF